MDVRGTLALVVVSIAALPVVTARAAAAEPAAPPLDVSAFTWEVSEPRIVIGDTGRAVLTLTARTADGAPLDVATPKLVASAGSLSSPVRQRAGVWTATFVPPREAFPHVAIVVAVIDTAQATAVGFVSLHLWGKGQTTVKTKPRSQVTVFIGNESFGPVAADDDGKATVPIVVPPGPERAVARSIDDVGNESQKTIDLGVPPFNRLAVVALDDVAAADGGGSARLLAFAVNKIGEPLYEAPLEAQASAGAVDAPVPLSPGMFELVYRPGKAPRGDAVVDVKLAGAPASLAKAKVQLLSGAPARAALDTKVSALSADAPRAVTVSLRVLDGAGNAVPASAASVDVDYGRIDSILDADDGSRTVTWIVPAVLPPAGAAAPVAHITARSKAGAVLGTRALPLLPGKPAKISFDPVDAVVADGTSAVDVHLRVVDAAGNALVPRGASLAVTDADKGQLVGATVDGKLYRARFIPVALDRADFARVHGALGALGADVDVKLVPRPRARLLVGPGLIAATNYGALVQAGPDISLLVRLPGFDGSVHAGLSVSLLQAVAAPAGVDHRAFPLFVEAAWRPLLNEDVALHLGGGAGFVITDEIDAGGARTVLPGAAAQAVAGAGYRLGAGFLELDARAGFGATFPAAAARVGAPIGAGLVLGYRFGI